MLVEGSAGSSSAGRPFLPSAAIVEPTARPQDRVGRVYRRWPIAMPDPRGATAAHRRRARPWRRVGSSAVTAARRPAALSSPSRSTRPSTPSAAAPPSAAMPAAAALRTSGVWLARAACSSGFKRSESACTATKRRTETRLPRRQGSCVLRQSEQWRRRRGSFVAHLSQGAGRRRSHFRTVALEGLAQHRHGWRPEAMENAQHPSRFVGLALLQDVEQQGQGLRTDLRERIGSCRRSVTCACGVEQRRKGFDGSRADPPKRPRGALACRRILVLEQSTELRYGRLPQRGRSEKAFSAA